MVVRIGFMKTEQERIESMHARAAEIRRQRERQSTMMLSALSMILFAGLVTVLARISALHQIADSEGMTGSSLLDSSAGGYVLIAVIAFTLGAVITVLCLKGRKNKGNLPVNTDRTGE